VRFSQEQSTCLIHDGEDPHGWFPRIAGDWTLDGRLQLGRITEAGDVIETSASTFNAFDFVDVGAGFDIATSRQANGQLRTRVHLALTHVLQMKPADNDHHVVQIISSCLA
jgi:hypothetical protein